MGTGTSQIPQPNGTGDFEYNGYKVIDNNQGFQPSELSLGIVGAYIAVKDGQGYGFAFHVSTLAMSLRGVKLDQAWLARLAADTVKARLDSGNLQAGEEYTFECNLDEEPPTFAEVTNPNWWIKTSQA